jgi:hypothetical protein
MPRNLNKFNSARLSVETAADPVPGSQPTTTSSSSEQEIVLRGRPSGVGSTGRHREGDWAYASSFRINVHTVS